MIKITFKVLIITLLIICSPLLESQAVAASRQLIQTEKEELIQAELNAAQEKETEIIVQFKPGLSDKRNLLSSESAALIKETKSAGSDIFIFTPQSGADSEKIIKEIKKDDSVVHVESNLKHKLSAAPNDPGYSKQWGLTTIKAEQAWSDIPAAKKAVTVAVIDSGAELSHSDLQGRISSGGYNFILENDHIYDVNGHGTAVAGVIAAKTNNKLGIAGVAGTVDVRILPLQVANYAGEIYISDVISAIDYAIAEGVDVINLSLGSTDYSAIENKAVQRAIQAGIIVVASAGNSGNSDYSYPASYDNVISVGAINSSEQIADFSTYNDRVSLVAPGVAIYSCSLNNTYASLNGTSFSAPMVTGIAAVLRTVQPSLAVSEVKDILEESAQDRGKAGRDNIYGYGIADMEGAVKQVSVIPVEGISVTPQKLHLTVGGTAALTAGFTPSQASNQTLAWFSDDPAIAGVDSTGRVTGNGIGQTQIRAVSEDGGKIAECTVKVEKDFAGLEWESKTNVSLNKSWIVKFSQPLKDKTLIQEMIYVVDAQGGEYPVETTINDEQDEVVVSPSESYSPGDTYYLIVSDGILSESGKSLAQAVKMKFVTQE